jgi:haloalkane dehalogenase
VVHDFGGPFALARALAHPAEVERVALLNTFMWAPEDDDELRAKARAAGTGLFRLLYRYLNFSQRVLVPFSYGDRGKYTAAQRRAVEGPFFDDHEARVRVLYALARSMTQSRAFFTALWAQRDALADKPLRAIWGLRDGAFTPRALARFQAAWPALSVVELAGAGHWPQEEEPARVVDALRDFLVP